MWAVALQKTEFENAKKGFFVRIAHGNPYAPNLAEVVIMAQKKKPDLLANSRAYVPMARIEGE